MIIISSYRFQIYRQARVVAAISNVRQYVFLPFRLILESSGKFLPGYALGKQSGTFKDVATLMGHAGDSSTLCVCTDNIWFRFFLV